MGECALGIGSKRAKRELSCVMGGKEKEIGNAGERLTKRVKTRFSLKIVKKKKDAKKKD